MATCLLITCLELPDVALLRVKSILSSVQTAVILSDPKIQVSCLLIRLVNEFVCVETLLSYLGTPICKLCVNACHQVLKELTGHCRVKCGRELHFDGVVNVAV